MAYDLFQKVNDWYKDTTIDKEEDMVDVPKPVRRFLGELGMLQHIPIHYLIPDERYLEIKEGNDGGVIKLFWLDKEWLECLTDGALSLAESMDDRKLLLRKALAGNYVAEVFYEDSKSQIKQQLYGTYGPDDYADKMKERLEKKNIQFLENGQPNPTSAQNAWCYTGFLMRSTLISSWVGVEIIAEGRDPNEKEKTEDNSKEVRSLQVIRLERLADDTLFVLCEGIISRVEIKQPAEGFHFGFNAIDGPMKAGPEGKEVSVPFRNGPAKGVVDINALQSSLKADTSAKLAEAVKSRPMQVAIDISWKSIDVK